MNALATATSPLPNGFAPAFGLSPQSSSRPALRLPAPTLLRRSATRLVDLLGPEGLTILTRVARGLAQSRDEADELVQDGLLRALNGGVSFDTFASLSAWMHTVMYRMAIDRTRRARRRRWDSAPLETIAAAPEPEPHDNVPAPWTGLDIGDVRAAAASLPDTLRETFRLFAFERRTYEEIAVLVGVPVRTVGTRLCRARKKLRGILQNNRTVPFCTREEGSA
jgi:RNA polymerase sigma-70 factor (ECF subfamily)